MNKHTLLIMALLLCGAVAWGQFRPMENYPSPQVASLGQYGDIPVSLFTGQPNISIPLYEVKEGDISVPISLNYTLSNVKPNRRSGWVGLGWNLSAGGYITRNVTCFFNAQNLQKQTKQKHNYFSPEKRKKKKEKKDMQVKKQCSGGCQGFLEKNTTRSVAKVWRFFFKNPQGLTFTDGKRNC